jgi:D-alanine-D-alanine ligase
VAVLFGGASSEHAISCISAAAVIAALREVEFVVIPIVISPRGAWCYFDGTTQDLHSRAGALPSIDPGRADVSIALEWDSPGFVIRGERVPVDAVFPVLHGPWGEDGTVQGLLEVAGMPYVGSGVLASAAAMDKITMKRLLGEAGLPIVAWQFLGAADTASDIELNLPVFVKPSRAGSSRGITRVADHEGLAPAISVARRHDPRVIVEAAITDPREIECAVRELPSGEIAASCCAEIVVDKAHEFYDFDAKYIDTGVTLQVPADLPADVRDGIRHLAVRSFRALGCSGLARVDFFVKGDGTILVNEVNTMPGFTPISMFPQMWEASGVPYPELVRSLVELAINQGTGLR